MTILNTLPVRVDSERRISFEWTLQAPSDTVREVATLTVSHDRQRKQLTGYLARDWREDTGRGWRHSIELGGPAVNLAPWPQARFSQKRLEEYAVQALDAIREKAAEPKVVEVMTPSDRSCGCTEMHHRSGCPVYAAKVQAMNERALLARGGAR